MSDISSTKLNTQQGSVSILALLAMMLLLALGGTMLSVSSAEVRTAASFRDGVAAQYAAEAGAKKALLALSTNNGTLPETIHNQPLGPGIPGTYTVTVEKQGINRVITATGTVGNASRQVIMEIAPETVYDFAAYSDKDMTLGLNIINGSVGSNQDINFTALTRVNGDAIAHGRVRLHTGFNDIRGRIMDSKSESAPPYLPLPTFIREDYKNGERLPGSWFSSIKLDNKIYYHDDNISFGASTISGPGIIYATGNITIGFATIKNNVILISEKDIIVPALASINNTALVARENIEIWISDFNGSAVAGGTIFAPVNFMAHPPAKSNYNVTKNPYIPKPPLWVPERVKVGYWNNLKLSN
ncbi:MAG: hypothetical protein GX348_04625 [Veillonellaceae bacterium]|jgi:hypothetical protein|nr:hypothetical protein [Veillonellaceae bacterium]